MITGRGSRGRSPLFYKLVKNIRGVKIANIDTNSIELIQNSVFISTITGTVALEASILGKKALAFGSTWFPGCPNVISWHDGLSYKEIRDKKVEEVDEIKNYLKNHKNSHSVIGFQNGSAMRRFTNLISENFNKEATEGVKTLIEMMISKI